MRRRKGLISLASLSVAKSTLFKTNREAIRIAAEAGRAIW